MEFIKKFIPEAVLKAIRPCYHGAIALFANWYFGQPSRKMIVIGVTGTAGKSTTVQMLARILNFVGKKCGFITTISFFNGNQEYINKHGLSMPGGWGLERQLKSMLRNGCKYAVIECTSEGLEQNRHLGIEFDMAVFTNLSEAHIEAHRGFQNYRRAKGKLFRSLVKSHKPLADRTIVVNADDESAAYFLSFRADRKLSVGFSPLSASEDWELIQAQNPDWQKQTFDLGGAQFEIGLLGRFNLYNAALAAVSAFALGVSFLESARALLTFNKIRGRMEAVPNNRGVTIIVDYGCEPATIKAALLTVKDMPHKRIIHVFGSTGGHRDRQKRFLFGKVSAEYADEIIITNDDVYNSNPEEIARNIVSGIKENPNSKFQNPNYQIILDRRSAINKALRMAQQGDIVLITGKGSEQFLVLPGNKRVEWDEVEVIKQELSSLN